VIFFTDTQNRVNSYLVAVMHPYKIIFDGLHSTLKKNSGLSEEEFDKRLDKYKKFENRDYSDDEYFDKLVQVVFYSGFKEQIVNAKLDIIKSYFSNYQKVLNYGEHEIKEMMQDEKMIKNRDKIESCIKNARTFKELIEEYGSFQRYVNSFKIKDSFGNYSFENLMLFKEEIEFNFSYLGTTTSYHFMTDIGLPVLKPDRVVKRIFCRLGFIDTQEMDKQILKTIIQGRKMSEAVGWPIRAVDIILIRYGQVGKDEEFDLEGGICLEANPKCHICGVKKFCHFAGNI